MFQVTLLIFDDFCFCLQSLQRAAVISDRMKEQLAELKRAKKKIGGLELEFNKAKLSLTAIDHLKEDLTAAEQAQDASYASATQAKKELLLLRTGSKEVC